MPTPYETHTPYNPSMENYSAFMQQNFNPNLQIGQTGAVNPTTITKNSAAAGGFNANPGPQTGSGTAYGRVPGATPVPPSTYTQVAGVYPGLGKQAGQISSNVMSELQGVLSPETIDSIQQHAAQFGVTSGMPLSGFAANQGLRSLGLNTEAVQQQGLQGYLSALSGIGNAQLPPALLAQIAGHNAELAAAPDPEMAAKQMISNYQGARNAYGGGPSFMAQPFNPAGGTGKFSGYTQDADLTNQALQSTSDAVMVGGKPYYPMQHMQMTSYQPEAYADPMYYNNYDPSQPYAATSTGTGEDQDQGLQDFYGIPFMP